MHPLLLLIFGGFLTFLPFSFEDCRTVTGTNSVANYMCDSIQDLHGKLILLDVLIRKDGVVSRQTKTPKFTATLAQKTGDKFDLDVVIDLQKVYNIANSISHQTGLNRNTFGDVQLAKIHLNNGHLTSIEPGTFSNFKKVEEIRIVHHALERIASGVFSDLPIVTLALSNNRIIRIEQNALNNLNKLKNLHLDGNLLSDFSSSTKELETLHLQDNSLSAVSRSMFKISTKLRVLNLSRNKIITIASHSFEDLLQLERLNLADNMIGEFKSNMFPNGGFPVLAKLNIAYNGVREMSPDVLQKLQTVGFISIGGNPWHCLSLEIIQAWMGKNDVKQVCDDEYIQGDKPICVLESSDQLLYDKYRVQNKPPRNYTCTDLDL